MTRHRILIVSLHQFGYLTDTLKYTRNLTGTFDISFVCWDYGARRIAAEDVRVVYVPRSGPRIARLWRFVAAAAREFRTSHCSLAFIVYFRGCVLLRVLLRNVPTVLDFRTGSDRPGLPARVFENWLMRLESRFFPRVTIISRSLMEAMRLNPAKCHILPLGGDPMDISRGETQGLHLVYVGTLDNREMYKTVEGFDRFCREAGESGEMSYDIVGGGSPKEVDQLTSAISNSPYGHLIRFHGRIPNTELRPVFEKNNFGVAFIPMKDYYHCQPSTKVFEYLLAGLPVLATATHENAAVINDENGVLFEDTAEGFCRGLRMIYQRKDMYDREAIKAKSAPYAWSAIVRCNLIPYLDSVLKEAHT